jgi:hypothetical protein
MRSIEVSWTETPLELNLEHLIGEIERYLTAVELFRAEGCAPQWANATLDDPEAP